MFGLIHSLLQADSVKPQQVELDIMDLAKEPVVYWAETFVTKFVERG